MTETRSTAEKARRLLVVLVPILFTQTAISAIQVTDTMMSGRFSADDLAGVAIGANLWMPFSTGLLGVLSALTPIVSQHLGAGRRDEVSRSILQGIYLAIALAIAVIAGIAWGLPPLLSRMSLENEVNRIAREYLLALAWGIPALFITTILRSFFDALGLTRVTMAITLSSLPINVLLNYLLIFGAAGLPRLGGVGAGYASAITYWLMVAASIAIAHRRRPFRDYRVFNGPFSLALPAWREHLRVGVPIGLTIAAEVGIFSMVAILISRFGTEVIAAHQSAISFASLIYMVPLSISMALTILVGYEVGAGRIDEAIRYRRLGIGASLSASLVSATCLSLFNPYIASLYTADPGVYPLVRTFLYYAIFFQFSDALSAPIQGTLRGYKDVKAVLGLSLLSFWGIGLPLGHALAVGTPLGPPGYWVGLISGLASGAVGLIWRLRRTERAFAEKALAASQSSP